MSKERALLRERLQKQEVSKPLTIASELTFTAPKPANVPDAQLVSRSGNSEETGSKLDRVQNSPGSFLTGSKFDPIEKKGIEKISHYEALESARSKTDPVKFEQGGAGFTQVPHALLRSLGMFEDPIDFMIYLHLFTYSWGYQRETVDMGLTQLERFTGAARNTIRKSLERLSARKWITEVQKQEPGRISRKWRIRNPSPMPDGPTGSKIDPVRNEPGQPLTPRGSKSHPVTGSKIDPYIESSKQTFKKTLSLQSEKLREYFASIKEPRKRESEAMACRELLGAYPEGDIATALEHVQTRGIGERRGPCHSPMAYLAKAMGDVLDQQRKELESKGREASRKLREEQSQREQEQQSALEQRRHEERELAFCAAHPDPNEQERILGPYVQRFAAFVHQSELLRRLALGAWEAAHHE